jgi:oligopeptidase A
MNPFLSQDVHIPFAEMIPEEVEPALDEALARAQSELDALVAAPERSFTMVLELDALVERLGRPMGFVSHLTSVKDSPELRRTYNEVLPRYTAFMTRLSLNPGLWNVIKEVAATSEAAALTGVRKRHLDKTVQEFIRAGADLPDDQKARVEAINIELSGLSQKFSENTLDATNAFELVITDEAELAGLPESAKRLAKAAAEAKGQDGWRFTLQVPSYLPVMTYAENRALRETLHRAYTSRAGGGDFDNREIIVRTLALRRERAELLGFETHADYVLEPRMVSSAAQALAFVRSLTERTRPYWQEEVGALEAFAETLGLSDLKPWDVSFVTERLRQQRYAFDEEELRPFFPLNRVLEGMFSIAEETFGVTVTRRDNPQVWHEDVDYYDLHDAAARSWARFTPTGFRGRTSAAVPG